MVGPKGHRGELRVRGRASPAQSRATVLTDAQCDHFGHTDQPMKFVGHGGFCRPPRETFVVHAEEKAPSALVDSIYAVLGRAVAVARDCQTAPL